MRESLEKGRREQEEEEDRSLIQQFMDYINGSLAFSPGDPDGGSVQDYAYGGQVNYMQEGGMAPVNPMAGMPVPQDAAMPPMAQAGGIDPAIMEQMLMQAQQSMTSLDEAESAEEVMNAMRGDEASVEDRRMELADIVGREDAQQTPESVLTLVQPVMMMAQVDQGIGGLAQDQMGQPVSGNMAQGIMSTVDMGAEEGPAPVNFNQGGVVGMAMGGNPFTAPSLKSPLQQEYEMQRDFYGQLLNEDEQTRALKGQQDLTQAQMLFDLAQTGLAIAAPGPRNMSVAEKLAYAAQQTQLFPKIGERAAALEGFKQKQVDQKRQMDLAAAQGAMDLRNKRIAAGMENIGTPYDIEVIDNTSGKVIGIGRGPVTREYQSELQARYPNASIRFSPISTAASKGPNFKTVLDKLGKPVGTFDINTPSGYTEADKLLSANKGYTLGDPKFPTDTDQKPYNLIKDGKVVAVLPGSDDEQKLLSQGYAVAASVSTPNEFELKGVKL